MITATPQRGRSNACRWTFALWNSEASHWPLKAKAKTTERPDHRGLQAASDSRPGTAPLGDTFPGSEPFRGGAPGQASLSSPVFQRVIAPAFCIPPKQRHGVLMSADLVLIILLREVGAIQALEFVQHFLVRAGKV